MDNFLTSIFSEPNFLYIVLITSAWIGVVALFVPGTGVIELTAAIGLLVGLGGLASAGSGVVGLGLFGFSFGLYALALLRLFSQEAGEWRTAMRWPASIWALALSATLLQFFGGVALNASLPDLSLVTVALLAVGSFAIFRWMLTPTVRALHPPPQAGAESLIGERAEVRFAPEAPGKPGTVFLSGELWQAVADAPLAVGDTVEVIKRDGMRLHVRRLEPPDQEG